MVTVVVSSGDCRRRNEKNVSIQRGMPNPMVTHGPLLVTALLDRVNGGTLAGRSSLARICPVTECKSSARLLLRLTTQKISEGNNKYKLKVTDEIPSPQPSRLSQ